MGREELTAGRPVFETYARTNQPVGYIFFVRRKTPGSGEAGAGTRRPFAKRPSATYVRSIVQREWDPCLHSAREPMRKKCNPAERDVARR